MKNSLRIHKWTHNEFNIFILGVLTRPHPHPLTFPNGKPMNGFTRHIYKVISIEALKTNFQGIPLLSDLPVDKKRVMI